MKRIYESPEFEVLKCELLEDVLQMSYETTVPDITMPSGNPGGEEIPDF